MKRYLFALFSVGLFGGITTQAQNEKKATPPAVVVNAFEKEFAGSTHVKWEKEGANFEANFSKNGKEESALYDASGKLLETEWEIPVAELPKPVTEYLASNYKGAKITEASKVQKADGTTMYEAEVKGKELVFDANGKFINQEKK